MDEPGPLTSARTRTWAEVNVRPRPLVMGTGGKTKLRQTRLHCGGSRVLTTKHLQPTGSRYIYLHVWVFVDVLRRKHAKRNI